MNQLISLPIECDSDRFWQHFKQGTAFARDGADKNQAMGLRKSHRRFQVNGQEQQIQYKEDCAENAP